MGTPPAPDARPDSYAAAVRRTWADTGMWDYLRYDDAGDLWLGGLRVRDAVATYGAPLEIVDTTLVERRCAEFEALARRTAADVGYRGRLRYLYAAKANMASEVAHAAYRSGWGAETSARQDLVHLVWLERRGLLPARHRVVCNGFKLPTACFSLPGAEAAGAALGRDRGRPGDVCLPPTTAARGLREQTYAEAIVDLARAGWDITPILDEGELPAFEDAGLEMTVGLRLKHGRVSSTAEMDALVSRFGMDRATIAETAARVDAHPRLRLTTLHAMVGAAEEIPVDEFVRALVVGVSVWADLRTAHPTMQELNVGGGLPPLGEPYDHRAVLEGLLRGAARLADERGLPPPDVTFELGSLVAAECGFHVLRVVQDKRNHAAAPGTVDTWAVVDGGLMAAIPDMLFLDKPFRFLAVEGAHRLPRVVRLGDVTCDSDGRYPPRSFGPDAGIELPVADGSAQHVLIQGVGADQEILAGVRGAHHCGLLEAIELVLERRGDGRVHGRLLPRQTPRTAAEMLGYVDESVPALAAAMEATPGRAG